MKRQWVKQGNREYEIRCHGVTVERRLTEYNARTDRKWQVAYANPTATIEVVHTPTGEVVDALEPVKMADTFQCSLCKANLNPSTNGLIPKHKLPASWPRDPGGRKRRRVFCPHSGLTARTGDA